MTTFPELVRRELTAARTEHNPGTTHHHYFGVLLEEVYEYFDEIRKKPRLQVGHRILAELVQVGAMAQRAAEDMALCDAASSTNGLGHPNGTQNAAEALTTAQEANHAHG